MKVLKFGGTSVKEPGIIRKMIQIVQETAQSGPVVVAVSAFGGVTDELIGIAELARLGDPGYLFRYGQLNERCVSTANELVQGTGKTALMDRLTVILRQLQDVLEGVSLVHDLSPKTLDFILAFGERISSTVIGAAFQEAGSDAEVIDSRTLIHTDSTFGMARVNVESTYAAIRERLGDLKGIAVVPGFISSNETGDTTTLGRGGSDYSAAIYAAALDAEILEIWTDVSGMMTADPRKVKQALPLAELSYWEAMELSHFGAKVVYLPSLQPVMKKEIPIAIKNTFEPDSPGTLIRAHSAGDAAPVSGISSIDSIALLSLSGSGLVGVPGSSMRLFGALYREGINIMLITQASSEHSISFAILPAEVDRARASVEAEFAYELSLGKVDPLSVETGLLSN